MISLRDIASVVASQFNVSPEALRSSSRSQDVRVPRQIAMMLAREHTSHSLSVIGRWFRKHNATVLHSITVAPSHLLDERIAEAVVAIRERLKNPAILRPLPQKTIAAKLDRIERKLDDVLVLANSAVYPRDETGRQYEAHPPAVAASSSAGKVADQAEAAKGVEVPGGHSKEGRHEGSRAERQPATGVVAGKFDDPIPVGIELEFVSDDPRFQETNPDA